MSVSRALVTQEFRLAVVILSESPRSPCILSHVHQFWHAVRKQWIGLLPVHLDIVLHHRRLFILTLYALPRFKMIGHCKMWLFGFVNLVQHLRHLVYASSLQTVSDVSQLRGLRRRCLQFYLVHYVVGYTVAGGVFGLVVDSFRKEIGVLIWSWVSKSWSYLVHFL